MSLRVASATGGERNCGAFARGIVCCLLTALGISVLSSVAVAQVIPPSAQPGRERQQFIEPRAPAARPSGAGVSLPSTEAPPGAATTMIVVSRVQIVGSTVYSAEDLAPLYQGLLGQRVPLQAIYDLARAVTAKYGADGYVLSRAIVPPQELRPGGAAIRIQVVEGHVSRVEWPPQLGRYRDFFSYYAARITAERPANIRTIERYMLLAGGLPGLKFSTTLKASQSERGGSTLVVEVVEKPLDVFVRVDNRGSLARGPLQFLVSPTINNVFGQHDALTFAYAAVSPLKELQFVAPSYKQVLTAEGLTAFVNTSYSWGRPGTPDLETLNFKTKSLYAEGGLSYPVIRTRERNLIVSALMFSSDSYSYILDESYNVDRLRGVRLRVDGDSADSLNGINQFTLTLSQGFQGLGSTTNGSELASRAAGRVDFTKFEAYGSRLQPLAGRFSALISAYGQYSATALLAPEQCGFGGRLFGRAFDPSEILGDRCWVVSAELRFDLPMALSPGANAQLYAFTDTGKAYTINAAVGTAASTTGTSAGGGVRLGWQNYVNVDLSVAKAVEGPRDDWRFFFITTGRY